MTYDKELEFAKELAAEASAIMLEWFKRGMTKEWKGDRTPVTEADLAINNLVIERVQSTFPTDAVLGEEASTTNISPRVWVCDPVDGTLPYSHGIPLSTFSLALTIDGKPVVGIIMQPFINKAFTATMGGGAFCNGEQLHVNQSRLDKALVELADIPAHNENSILPLSGALYDDIIKLGGKCTAMWSCIFPGAMVAAGQYTGVIFNNEKPVDGAAVKIIVEEAGGKVTDLFGNEQRYDQPIKGFVASNGVVHDELLALLKSKSPVA